MAKTTKRPTKRKPTRKRRAKPKAKPDPDENSQILVIASDLHCGSSVALCPPGFITNEGNQVGLNMLQQWLWECWDDAWCNWLPSVIGNEPYDFIANGDLVDGNHHNTFQLVSPDPIDHARAAVQILAPIVHQAKHTYLVTGTEVHVGNVERGIGEVLQTERNPDTGHRAWDRLLLSVNGTLVSCSHHTSCTTRPWSEASALSTQLAIERQEAVRAGHDVPQVVIKSHRHKYSSYDDGYGMSIITPPWQGLTRYGYKVVPGAITNPGLVVLDFRGTEPGELPAIRRKMYTAPQASVMGVVL